MRSAGYSYKYMRASFYKFSCLLQTTLAWRRAAGCMLHCIPTQLQIKLLVSMIRLGKVWVAFRRTWHQLGGWSCVHFESCSQNALKRIVIRHLFASSSAKLIKQPQSWMVTYTVLGMTAKREESKLAIFEDNSVNRHIDWELSMRPFQWNRYTWFTLFIHEKGMRKPKTGVGFQCKGHLFDFYGHPTREEKAKVQTLIGIQMPIWFELLLRKGNPAF